MTGDEGPEDGTVVEREIRISDVADDEGRLRAEVISRLRGQLSLMRTQVGRLQQALNQAENLRTAARERLQSLRGTTERLEQALRMEEAAQHAPRAAVPAAAADPDATAEPSWRPVTTRGGQQKNHLVRVDLREQHIHALLVSGVLSIRDVDHAGKVGQVVQALLDRWAEQYGVREVAQPAAQTARERRRAEERRHAAPRANCLLSYVKGTPFDRRQQDERRHGPDGSVRARRLPSREPAAAGAAPPGAAGAGATVVRLDELRVRAEASPRRPWPSQCTDNENGLGSAAPIVLFPLAHREVKGIEGEPAPDADEACERRSGNGLLVSEDREQELAGRRDELQDAQHGERDPARGGDEEDER